MIQVWQERIRPPEGSCRTADDATTYSYSPNLPASNEGDNLAAAFVSGGGSGIGRAVALALAERGFAIGVMDVSTDAARDTLQEVRALGGRAQPFVGDVSHDADVEAAVRGTEVTLGALETAVTAARIEAYGSVTDMDLGDWHRALAVNLTGTMLVARHAVPLMLKNGGGAFVAISSDAGVLGSPRSTPCSVSKHAVIGLVRCLATEYGASGIRSNVVC